MNDRPPSFGVIAVTGASGLIGKHVVARLSSKGFRLRLLTRADVPESMNAEYVRGDLLSGEALRALVKDAAAVVHLAGVAHTTLNTEGEQQRAYRTNVGGTQAVVQAALEAGVPRFVFMSSAHVYAGQKGIALNEESPTTEGPAYSQMKLKAEAAVQQMENASPGSTIILRPCLVYGPGVRFNLESLIRAVRRRLYVHPGKLTVMRSMASVYTLAAAVEHALRNDLVSGTYNVADLEPVQLRTWVNGLADSMQVSRPWTVPLPLLRALATAGSIAHSLGLPAPLTRNSLGKLTESFTLDVSKLAATGFVWPSMENVALQQMVDAALAKRTP